jgi:hypothetical protein
MPIHASQLFYSDFSVTKHIFFYLGNLLFGWSYLSLTVTEGVFVCKKYNLIKYIDRNILYYNKNKIQIQIINEN